MFKLRTIFGTSAFLLAGLVFAQASCTNDNPMSVLDMISPPAPDMAVPVDGGPAAAPAVSAVAPLSGANNVATALTLTGSGFLAGATVSVGGQPCTNVMVSSPTTLTCSAPTRSAVCGAQDIVVTNPDMQSGTGSKLFRYTSRAFAIGAPTPIAASTTPAELLAVDLNNDGKLDLVNTNRAANTVSISLGNGDGTFGTQTTVMTGTTPVGLAAGDMNGDGKVDLVVANSAAAVSTLSFLAGNGSGGFAAKVDTMLGVNTSPFAVLIADVNADQKRDVVVALSGAAAIAVRLGDGAGGFMANPPANVTVGTTPTFIALGDLDGDGDLDVAVSCQGNSTVHIRTNNGSGVFAGSTSFTVPTTPGKLALADFTSDGMLDLAITSQAMGSVNVFTGAGNGTFSATGLSTAVGTTPVGIAAADLNGDGRQDLVSANSGSLDASVVLGQGGGTFLAATGNPFMAGTTPFGVVVADLDNNGLLDFVVSNSGSANLTSRLQNCQ